MLYTAIATCQASEDSLDCLEGVFSATQLPPCFILRTSVVLISRQRVLFYDANYLESDPQQMDNQDEQPPNHTTYSANEYRDEVDGNRGRNKEVSHEQEYQSNDGINGQPHQQRGCSREQGQHC